MAQLLRVLAVLAEDWGYSEYLYQMASIPFDSSSRGPISLLASKGTNIQVCKLKHTHTHN